MSASRRSFLKHTALAAGALAFAPSAFAQETKQRPIRKAIMYATVGIKGSVLEKLRAVKEAGFEGVEMMSHLDQDEVASALKETGLQCPSVCGSHHWASPLSDANPGIRQKGLDALKQTLRDAKRWGAPSILLVPAVVNERVSYDEAYKRSQEEIRKAVPLAEELQVKISIENVWNQFLLSPLEAARYVDEFNSPWVGWHFDIGNLINYGWPEQWIRILGKRINALHIKEFSRKRRDEEGLWKGFDVKFTEGDNRWPAIMKAIDDIGYKGWGIAEQPGGGTPEGLRDLAQRMDKIFAM